MIRFDLSREVSEIIDFLSAGGNYGYFWTSGTQGQGKLTSWYKVGDLRSFPQNWIDNQWNVYFGVNPVFESGTNLQRAKLEEIASIRTLFAEFDAKTYGSKEEIRDHVANLVNAGKPKPTMIVDSGGGYHCYWFLKDPIAITDENRHAIKCKLYAWVDSIGGDDASKDLCRILRVPSTRNYKPEYETDDGFPIVTIEEIDWSALYTLDQLMEAIQYDPSVECAEPEREPIQVEPIEGPRLEVYCKTGIANELDELSNAQEGTRNHRLFKAAANIGGLIVTGGLNESDIFRQVLDAALKTGLPEGEAIATIKSGFSHGLQNPRKIEHTKDFLAERAYYENCEGDFEFFRFHYPSGYRASESKAEAKPKAHKPKEETEIYPDWLTVADGDVSLSELNQFQVNDEGNAKALLYLYPGRFAYNSSFRWMYYDGHKWATEGAEQYINRAMTATLEWRQRAALKSSELTVKQFPLNSKNVNSAISQFQNLVYVPVSMFDRKSGYINTLSGLVNLRTGEVEKSDPGHYLTHCIELEYDPNADMSYFRDWLRDACGSQQERWLQLMCGHALIGHPVEESLVYIVGPTRSGKGTFTETLQAVLVSPLSKELNFSTFVENRNGDSQNFDLAELVGARFIFATESKEHEKVNGAKLKAITGGSEIMCSKKHQQPFTYKPRYTIFLSSNFMPNISSDDEAAWGRVRLITFPKSHLGEEDKSLKQSMVTPRNLQAVLTWMVKGAIDYYALGSAGLSELQSSKDAKGIQSTLLDNVGAWIDEAVAATGQASDFTSFTDCMKSYQEWCKANAVTPKTANGLARSLEKKRLLLDPNARFEQATMGITRPGGSRSTVRGYKGMLIP